MTPPRPHQPRVVIAGGGTAGWVAAAALARQLGDLVSVTLVESDEIGTVGVGESTIPTVRTFHDLIRVDEREFLRATTATFKLGISFEGWLREGSSYFHAFGSVGRSVFAADFQHFWLDAVRRGFGGEYGDYSPELRAAAAGRFATGPRPPLAYAYHLDATAYARFLRAAAEAGGARRVEGRIERVERDAEDGDLSALVLASGERVEGDLFLDCTGFRALLSEGTLGTGWEDWGEWLATDSALAVQSEPTGAPVPYTRAVAHGAGWRWRIPLQQRVGNGLVFAADQLSVDEARARLLGALDGEPLFEPRLLRFRAGMRRLAWNRNCVALGLAGGFVEPLESTSIHLVMTAVSRLVQCFPFEGASDAARARYNAQSRAEWEHVRDFVILHYKLNERGDTEFWRGRAAMRVPDTLAERIELFREGAGAYQAGDEIFRVDSWVEVMLGQGVRPSSHHRLPSVLSDADLRRSLGDLDRGIRETVDGLPAHGDFVRGYCAA